MKKILDNVNINNFHFLDDLRSERGGKAKILSNDTYNFDDYEAVRMIYISIGMGIVKFNKKEFVVRSHDIFFVFPEYDYTFAATAAKNNIEFYWCDMRSNNLNIFLDYINISPFFPIIRGINNNNFEREMRILKSAYTNLSLADYLNYKGCIYKICSILINDFSSNTWRKIPHTSEEIVYSGNWFPWPSIAEIETGNYYSSEENSFAELSFYGSGVKWYGAMNFDCGIADVIVDGNYMVSVDTYSPERISSQILYSNNTLPHGYHIIKIVCAGQKNHLAKKSDIVIEGFQMFSDENNASIATVSLSKPLKKAIKHMESNYMKNETIHEIADKFGLSRSFFSTQFKKETGYSPKEYINNLKLIHAKEYLRNTDFSILEISELCGYNDVSYFMRVFKNAEKLTVSQYRNMNKR